MGFFTKDIHTMDDMLLHGLQQLITQCHVLRWQLVCEDRAEVQVDSACPRVSGIEQEIARERKLKNDDAEQDIRLKRSTLNRLFIFLVAETALIFLLAFFQGIHWPHHFHLEDWSFKLLVTATVAQITGMLFVAVRYLFPTKSSR